jgi:hypothetical protein
MEREATIRAARRLSRRHDRSCFLRENSKDIVYPIEEIGASDRIRTGDIQIHNLAL